MLLLNLVGLALLLALLYFLTTQPLSKMDTVIKDRSSSLTYATESELELTRDRRLHGPLFLSDQVFIVDDYSLSLRDDTAVVTYKSGRYVYRLDEVEKLAPILLLSK
ncbi:ORF096 [Saltwater crocodilepox virus]|nr:hypothetical protein [Saltwater crocodilepox virus]AVD69431.1 hypothetical protein [Saltwater crocodilepox virus]QGT46535.1 ORF096 [Saltwater crocodilepox virus]QGT46751.1 ORF096 [Saltwater crocodilepox virus]QGT46967.1 ORF096 [Saltwater crocodilepox virus]